MKWLVFLILGSVFLLSGCGHNEGLIQSAERSYLKFTGNLANATVDIDNAMRFSLPKEHVKEQDNGRLYQLTPGRHELMVYRSGRIIVNRIIILNDQTTMEVPIP